MRIYISMFCISFILSFLGSVEGYAMERNNDQKAYLAYPVVFKFGTIIGDKTRIFDLLPDMVLYRDGSYLVTKNERNEIITNLPYLKSNIEIGHLSNDQFCKILDLNKNNIFDQNFGSEHSVKFDKKSRLVFLAGINNSNLKTKINRKTIIETYEIIKGTKGTIQPYKPSQVLISFAQINSDDFLFRNFPPKKWIFKDIDLPGELIKNGGKPSRVVVKGTLALELYDYFEKSRFTTVFLENRYYKLYIRPLLPFEKYDPKTFRILPLDFEKSSQESIQCSN